MRNIVVFLLLSLALVPNINAQDERLQVVASFSILADVTQNVAGDAADVTSMIPVGADPHSFQAVPSDIALLANADVVFINGAFFEEGLLEAIENAGEDMNILEASACVNILPFGAEGHEHDEDAEHEHDEDADHEHDEAEEMSEDNPLAALCETHYAEMSAMHEESHEHSEDEDHDEEHEHDDEHEHVETLGALYTIDCAAGHAHEGETESEDEHEHGACDPHVWMEPHNVMYWTMFIRDTLIELDPANEAVYTANAAAYLEELDSLAHDFLKPLVETLPEENRVLVTNHDSFGYLAAAFDFQVAAVVLPAGTASDPSAQDIAGVIDTINELNVPAIFSETTVSAAIAETIAEETGAQLYPLYTGSLSQPDEPASTYLDYIRYNYTTIIEALGGGL